MTMSHHAVTRCQQRAIPPLVIQWLEEYGDERFDHHGAVILYFSKKSIRRLERAIGRRPVAKLKEYLNCYAVVSNGTVVTAGKRLKRIRH
jgi:hypothetical protein